DFKCVSLIDPRGGAAGNVGSGPCGEAARRGQGDQTVTINFEGIKDRGEWLGAGFLEAEFVDELQLAVVVFCLQTVAVRQLSHLPGHVLPEAAGTLAERAGATDEDVRVAVAAASVARALLAVHLLGRVRALRAVLRRGCALATIR